MEVFLGFLLGVLLTSVLLGMALRAGARKGIGFYIDDELYKIIKIKDGK